MECGEELIMLSTVGNYLVFSIFFIFSMHPGALTASLLWDAVGSERALVFPIILQLLLIKYQMAILYI